MRSRRAHVADAVRHTGAAAAAVGAQHVTAMSNINTVLPT